MERLLPNTVVKLYNNEMARIIKDLGPEGYEVVMRSKKGLYKTAILSSDIKEILSMRESYTEKNKLTFEEFEKLSSEEIDKAFDRAHIGAEDRIKNHEETRDDLIWFYVCRREVSDWYKDAWGIRPHGQYWYSAIWEDGLKGFENYREMLINGKDAFNVGCGYYDDYDDDDDDCHTGKDFFDKHKEEYEDTGDYSFTLSDIDLKESHIKEAQASLSYYGFKRLPSQDFGDDGTRFFMWVWDPEDTGKSPFRFSKAGGYGDVFFSEHFGRLSKLAYDHGYKDFDSLNGISKERFTDEAVGKLVKEMQEIRDSEWFAAEYPDFATKTAISNGIETKTYTADKDHQRVMDIAKRAGSDPEKMAKLAANMAKAIGDKEKMRSRWQAAIDVYGFESPVAKAFENQVKERGWHMSIRARSGDIDWSGLFESVMKENDESIYKAHEKYEKDQLKKKEEEDNQKNFTFDEGSVKLTTVKESDESIYDAHEEYEKEVEKKAEEDDNQDNLTFDEGSVKLTDVKESRTYWNNFFDRLKESETEGEEDELIPMLRAHFDTNEVERNSDADWGNMKAYDIDGDTYIIGDSDTAYETAKKEAARSFLQDYNDEDRINWLQQWNWPGVNEEDVCNELGDDPADYDEDETIYKPSSIGEYIDTMGYNKASDALSWDFLRRFVDEDEVGEFCVDYDGIANSLARFDGKEIEITHDLLAYRVY